MRSLSNQEKKTGLDELYELAQDMDVRVYGFPLPVSGAMSVMDNRGRCVIGLDNSTRLSASEEKTRLAHELGHCSTGAFYNEYTPFSLRAKCERRADEWAIRYCVPFDALISAYRSGLNGCCELAEHFSVSETFMRKALDYYIMEGKRYGKD